jgi:aldehyde dehydrogenase (NAD+)
MIHRFNAIFDAQQKNQYAVRLSTAAERIQKLNALKNCIEAHESDIYEALHTDLRKNKFESAVTEVLFIYSEIDFAIKNLYGWMKPQHAARNIGNLLAKNRIYYEPKGVCLIIAPWNYPFQLVMSPLISAIAAGNCVMVKPSEYSSATSGLLFRLLEKTFEEQEIACIEGDATVSTDLLKLPFDHIFFTGSTAIGKIVMEAASKHLSSVTLELGGKSPVIIDETTNIPKAAEKIAWGKLINAGQTCIAPDYALIHPSKMEEFIEAYKAAVTEMFFDKTDKRLDFKSFAKIINQKHYDRIQNLVNEATDRGAIILWAGPSNLLHQTIHPTLLGHLPEICAIMEEEIFGPILPIIPYSSLDEAIGLINRKNKPLALYIFSEDQSHIRQILRNTSSGGACINDVLIHISNPNLPFGGVNQSGMGSSHGFFGFKTFSHERAVVFQSDINAASWVYPPYKKKQWILQLLKKLM